MSYLKNCCPQNEDGSETYFANHQYICGNCGETLDDDGEDPENS